MCNVTLQLRTMIGFRILYYADSTARVDEKVLRKWFEPYHTPEVPCRLTVINAWTPWLEKYRMMPFELEFTFFCRRANRSGIRLCELTLKWPWPIRHGNALIRRLWRIPLESTKMYSRRVFICTSKHQDAFSRIVMIVLTEWLALYREIFMQYATYFA